MRFGRQKANESENKSITTGPSANANESEKAGSKSVQMMVAHISANATHAHAQT